MRFSDQSDESLLKASVTGRLTPFEELIGRHQQRLHNFCWRMTGSENLARQIFEESWGALYKHRASKTAASRTVAYLFATASAKTLSAMSGVPVLPALPGARAGAEASLEWRSGRLNEALLCLSPKERAVLLLTFFDSLSLDEAAICVGERADTTGALAASGLAKLKANLGPGLAGQGDQVLVALALETGLESDKALVKQTRQGVSRIQVAERLAEEAGDAAARDILLTHSRPTKQGAPGRMAMVYAGLALLSGLGFYLFQQDRVGHLGRGLSSWSAGLFQSKDADDALPFEFQPGRPGSSERAQPQLSADEKDEENSVLRAARKLLFSSMRHSRKQKPAAPPKGASEPAGVPANAPGHLEGADAETFSLSRSRLSLSRLEQVDIKAVMPESGNLELRLLDSSGRSVRLLANGPGGPGTLHFRFDCRDDTGRMIRPGTYYVRVITRWYSRVVALELQP